MAFRCNDCGNEFTLPSAVLQKYPNWTPKQCMDCRSKGASGSAPARKTSASKPKSSVTRTQDLSTSEVLARFSEGPSTGIFTDGSSRPNPGPGGWGAVYVVDNHVREEKFGHEPWTTNNRMELTAAIEALASLKRPCRVSLTTDSQYVKKGMNEWLADWKRRGWKTAGKKPVKNADLWQRLDAVVAGHTIEWHWVRGHTGHPENELADALANQAIDAMIARDP